MPQFRLGELTDFSSVVMDPSNMIGQLLPSDGHNKEIQKPFTICLQMRCQVQETEPYPTAAFPQ
jgi:hypothetical protein